MSQMLYADQSAREDVPFLSDFSSSCTEHSSCASAVKFYNMRVNLSVTHLAKFYSPRPILWPDLWALKIGHKFYHKFLICSHIA